MTEEHTNTIAGVVPVDQVAFPPQPNGRPVLLRAELFAAFKNDDGTIDWRDCPDCKQSATSMYKGKLGCTRCGWVEGNAPAARF